MSFNVLSLVGATMTVLHPSDGCDMFVESNPNNEEWGEYILDGSLRTDPDASIAEAREYGQIDASCGGSVSPEEFDKKVAEWLNMYEGVPFLCWAVEYDMSFSFFDIKKVFAHMNELLTCDCKWARELAHYVQDNRELLEATYNS